MLNINKGHIPHKAGSEGEVMKSELENQVPVTEQVEEIEQVDEAIEYSLGSDGTIAPQEDGIEKPEGPAEK